ncbi:MAG TPA: hypothetical protein PLT69_00070 [Deltaproteobacteria bacterium]|nr:hypothetical protein [Deltaproteobacteria bacterium]
MRDAHTMGFDTLLPLVILVLFFAVPSLFRFLARHSKTGLPRSVGGPTEAPSARREDEPEGENPWRDHEAERHLSGEPDNRPIHPRWF